MPKLKMVLCDWERLAEDGGSWRLGEKSRSILLKPGDVLIHAVHTLGDATEPRFTMSSIILDGSDVPRSLEMLYWIWKN